MQICRIRSLDILQGKLQSKLTSYNIKHTSKQHVPCKSRRDHLTFVRIMVAKYVCEDVEGLEVKAETKVM